MTRNVQFTRLVLQQAVKSARAMGLSISFSIGEDGGYTIHYEDLHLNVGECKAACMFVSGVTTCFMSERKLASSLSGEMSESQITANLRDHFLRKPADTSDWIRHIFNANKVKKHHRGLFNTWVKWLSSHNNLTGKHLINAANILSQNYRSHIIKRVERSTDDGALL